MIKVKGQIATFTGKDAKWLAKEAKALGMSKTNFFTGMLWESVMRYARSGGFLEKTKKRVGA
jgi:hypothetical protein